MEADTYPPPAEKSSIKTGYWKSVLARITKLESDSAARKVVLSNFCKHRLPAQQNFNLLDGKLNDLKTDVKASIVERLDIIYQNQVCCNKLPS